MLKNDTFREIIESPYHSTSGTNIHPDGITFYSTMFKNLSDTSVIDGEIKEARPGTRVRQVIASQVLQEIDGVEYILVTAGAPGTGNPHIDDAVKLYNRLGGVILCIVWKIMCGRRYEVLDEIKKVSETVQAQVL